jgi:hypothetical protein
MYVYVCTHACIYLFICIYVYTCSTYFHIYIFTYTHIHNLGNMENELKVCDESEHVVQIAFLSPLPIVAVSDSVGNIIFFGSRGSRFNGKRMSVRFLYICVFMYENTYICFYINVYIYVYLFIYI